MKNSLFKRAIAAAAAVPLALTQCLTYANAVSTDTIKATANVQAGEEALTLENLLYIPVEETVSKWNQTVTNSLNAIENREGTLDITPYVDDIVKNAGDFGEAAQVILTKYIIPNGVTYKITGSNDIVIEGKVSSPKQYNAYKFTPGEALDKVGKKYGAPDIIHKTTFESVDCSGDVTITIKASELGKGTKVPVSFEFKTADGSYGIAQLPEWAKTKIGEIQKVAEESIKANVAADKVDAAIADYEAEIKKLTDKLDKASEKIDWALNDASKSGEYANVAAIIADANKALADKGFKKTIPATATDIAAEAIVAKAYDQAMNIAAPNGEIAITAAQLGAFADSITDITASLASGVATGTGKFADAEKDAVIAYYADGSKGFTVTDSYKEITATVDYSGAKTVDTGSVDVQIKRVLVTETTTNTTTTAPIDTTTTTTQPIDTTTTTDDGETTTTTTDNGNTTTTTAPDVTTTTTTTETVVTSIVSKYVECDIDPAFYLSIEDSFDKSQVSNIKLHTFYDKTTTKGDVSTTEKGLEEVSILADSSVSFGDATPSNTYKKDNKNFKYEIPVLINGEKIADKEGNELTATVYIGVKGDTNLDSKVDAVDASQTLRYYALVQTGNKDKAVQLSESDLVDGPESVYDEFAAFLTDVFTTNQETRYTKKVNRTINATDASNILAFYALRQTSDNDGKTDKELWAEVLK
ncbi:cellulose-binding protein CttA-related protein [Ruminococcus flavefaciens]|uniref:cellulose-binding protein CttA-related protein n=1 Tax=Ruminococcus flavefaciens TaxID=1265 RepID=UPI00048EF14D|nr:cellulose-binding protein CttA-related protein [Ruminococcus flavefaciens]